MDLHAAEKAIRYGRNAAWFSAAMTLLVVSLAMNSEPTGRLAAWNDPWNFIDVGLVAALAIGVGRKSRVAALLLAVYFVGSKVSGFIDGDIGGGGLGMGLLFIYLFIRAVQGTFVYHRIQRAEGLSPQRMTTAGKVFSWLGGLIGVLLVGLLILGTMGPPLNVVTGEELSASDTAVLHQEQILEEGERVVLFYSAGLLSIREDGNLVTDRRVISYEAGTDGELWLASLPYEEILDVSVEAEGSLLNDAAVVITSINGEAFYLYLPAQAGGVERFMEEIERRMAAGD